MLADIGQQLPRARVLIEKAVKLEPKNGAYLDSLGWSSTSSTSRNRPCLWMLKPSNSAQSRTRPFWTILGDVYLALRQTDKAIAAWKKSLSLESQRRN